MSLSEFVSVEINVSLPVLCSQDFIRRGVSSHVSFRIVYI